MTENDTVPSRIKGGLRHYDTSRNVSIVVTKRQQHRPPDLEDHIGTVWQAALAKKSGLLFDGVILSVIDIGPETLIVTEDRYSAYFAQCQNPGLFESFPVRPLASSGFVTCPDGLLFAKRGDGMFLDPGKWELAPSGTFDKETIGTDGRVDPHAFLMRELNEEIGIDSADAQPGSIVGVYEHLALKSVDLVIAIDLSMTGPQIEETFSAHQNDEYSAIAIVPSDKVSQFASANADTFLPLSLQVLKQTGHL